MAKSFSDSAVLSLGWSQFKENAGFWIGAIIVGMIGIGIPGAFASALAERYGFLSFLFMVVYFVMAILVSIGWVQLAIHTVEKKKLEMATLFTGYKKILPYLGLMILMIIAVYAGLFLFVIPGVMLITMFFLAPYLVIDQGLGPIAALKESMKLTKGARWDILGFIFVGGIVSILGFLCLGIGMLVTIPVVYIAQAAVYKQLK